MKELEIRKQKNLITGMQLSKGAYSDSVFTLVIHK